MSEDIKLSLIRNELKLAGIRWYKDSGSLSLAFHGWLDNANSFSKIASELDTSLIAVDLPGHGFPSICLHALLIVLLLLLNI